MNILCVVLILCLSLASCGGVSSSPLVKTLLGIQFLSAGASVAAPELAAAGIISNDDATLIETVAQAVSTEAPDAITEAQSADTNPQKLVKITAIFDPVLHTVISSTVSAQASAMIMGIEAAVQALLKQLDMPKLAKLAKDHADTQLVFSRADRAQFAKINSEAKATNARARAWLTAHPKQK